MMHFGAYYEERFYIFGGFSTNRSLNADSWYRDDRMPTVKPLSLLTFYDLKFSIYYYKYYYYYKY